MRRVTALSSFSIFAFLAAGSASALTDDAATARTVYDNAKDDEIVVVGRFLSLDKINAVKTPTPIIDVPQSLSIIDSTQIANQGFTSIGDVTRYTPGVSISQGEGHRDAIVIRGGLSTADFFIDGIRDDVQYFRPLYNLEQIEVLRGANALLFGRGGTGGVINRVSKRPEFGAVFGGYVASVDTFGEHFFSGDVNYALGDSAALRLNAYYTGLDNHRDFFDGRAYAFNPTFAFKAGADTEILLSYEYVNDDRVVDRGVPSVPVAGGPDTPLEGFDNTFFGAPEALAPGDNRATFEAHILRGRIDHVFNDMLRGNLTAQYADYDKAYQNLFAAGFRPDPASDGDFITLDGYRDETDRENFFVQGNLIAEFDTGPIAHTILFGAEYGDQSTQNARLDNLFDNAGAPFFDPANADGVFDEASDDDQVEFLFTDPLTIPPFAFVDLNRDRDSQVTITSVYAQDQIDLTDWLKLVAGVRWDRFDIEVVDFIEVNDGADDQNDGFLARVDNEVSPRFGLILKPAQNISLYGSYSESFLPRSGEQFLTLDLTNEAAAPQRSQNFEVGAKWDITRALSATVALFRLERESAVTVDPLDVGNAIVLPGVVTQGVELSLTGRLTDRWSVNGGFSYLDGVVDGGTFDGNRTRQTPEFMVSAWNEFQASARLSLGLGVTHQSSYFAVENNAVEIPGYTRLDAALFYDLSDSVRLQVNIENLTNTDYFPDAHSNDNISTGAPTNARFTVSGRF